MSRVDSPREYSARILSSNPSKRRWRFLTILRLKAAVAITRRVDPHPTVLGHQASSGVVPLRVFPAPPGGSWWGS